MTRRLWPWSRRMEPSWQGGSFTWCWKTIRLMGRSLRRGSFGVGGRSFKLGGASPIRGGRADIRNMATQPTVILASGGIRSLVATAVLTAAAERHKLVMIHIKDGRANAPVRLDHL